MIQNALKQKIKIGTTRFTNETWQENINWKKKRKHDGS